MKYLLLSPTGLSLFLVPRLNKVREVETIYLYCGDTDMQKSLGRDMHKQVGWSKLELVSDYNTVLNMESARELVIFIDDVGMGQTGERLRRMGYRVIGGSPFADKIEDDRDFAQEVVKGIMNVPETESFLSFDDAISYVEGLDKATQLVFKPNDADTPKDYTYKAKDTQDMLSALKDFQSEWKWKEDFQLQTVVKGIEMDFNAYFNGSEYLPNSMFYYFENKALMNDDVGPATGGAIAVQFARKLEGQFADILTKLIPKLQEGKYVGQIAVNSIISEKDHKPYLLEFCGRVGYPSFPMDITALEDNGHSVHELFMALADQKTPTLFPRDKIAVTVWIGVPPYPYKWGVENNKGVPMRWGKEWDTYFFPYFVAYDAQKGMVLAGLAGEAVQVTCMDTTLGGALDMLYKTYIPTLQLKNKIYRTDCGVDARKRIATLKEWGVI